MASVDPSFVPFKNSRDRIKRADAHRNALTSAWNTLSEEELYTFSFYVNDDGTGEMRSTPVSSALPIDFSLTLGEFLYHLRAALDNAAYDAAIIDTGQNPPPDARNFEFPIHKNHRDFHQNAFKIAPLSDNRRAFIEAVQPYNTPKMAADLIVFNFNRTLGILSDWARKDRHRRLNIVRSWAVRAAPKLRYPPGVRVRKLKVHTSGFLENKDLIATFKLEGFVPGMKVQANPDLFIDIALDEIPTPLSRTDTLGNRLLSMIFTVEWITDHLERNLLPSEQ
jgi:hypothetical protein